MVLFFTSNATNPPSLLYMGADKYENEELIKYGLPEDVWFHVDKLSSAHVYVRLPEGQTYEDMPQDLIDDCVQLVKANSIEGNKKNDIGVVFTPWSNLKKTSDMAVGQVGFHNHKLVKKVRVEKRINEIVNRLNKTKEEKFPDLMAQQQAREQRDVMRRKREAQALKEAEDRERLEREREAELRSYSSVMQAEAMTSNKAPIDEDDFM